MLNLKQAVLLAVAFGASNSASAKIDDFDDMKPFSDDCANKIVEAIQRADRKSGYIGDEARMSLISAQGDEIKGDEIKTAEVQIDEKDYTRGYSIWIVTVKGVDSNCRVIKVEFKDSAT